MAEWYGGGGARIVSLRDTLSPAERAELDALLQELPPSDRALLRLIELFMHHQLAQAGMLNEELRSLLARQGSDLADHERRIRALEARGGLPGLSPGG